MNANEQRYTPEQVCEAIRETRGNLTAAGRLLGCDRRTVHNYRERYPEVARCVEDERDSLVDEAETALHILVQQGDWRAVHFTLRTLGAARGYAERVQLSDSEIDRMIETEISKRDAEENARLREKVGRLETGELERIVDLLGE